MLQKVLDNNKSDIISPWISPEMPSPTVTTHFFSQGELHQILNKLNTTTIEDDEMDVDIISVGVGASPPKTPLIRPVDLSLLLRNEDGDHDDPTPETPPLVGSPIHSTALLKNTFYDQRGNAILTEKNNLVAEKEILCKLSPSTPYIAKKFNDNHPKTVSDQNKTNTGLEKKVCVLDKFQLIYNLFHPKVTTNENHYDPLHCIPPAFSIEAIQDILWELEITKEEILNILKDLQSRGKLEKFEVFNKIYWTQPVSTQTLNSLISYLPLLNNK